jgi:hypothetical protein
VTETTDQILQEFHGKVGQIDDDLEAIKDGVRGVVADGHVPADEIVDTLHEAYDEADGEYAAALEARNEKLAQRGAQLRAELFGAPSGAAGPAFTNALTRAANADDDQLTALAQLAATTGDSTLGRAVFATAVQRGRADLGLPWLEANPEARKAFTELGTMPTPEERERALDFHFPRPSLGDLRPTGHEALEAERIERARRVQRAMREGG